MIEHLPLKRINELYAEEIHEAVNRVVDSGWYLRGDATARFEQEYARYIGTRHCIGVGNGLDALTLILRAYIYLNRLEEGDEVIVPANTYIATILSITENRLRPVLVEPDVNTLQIDDTLIEQAITPRTRALMIVHLYGRCAYTERIADLCRRHGLLLLEDNAQAHGAVCDAVLPHRKTGSLGAAAAHSFYPTKNLGALGDAGAVTTDDEQLATTVRAMANYGSQRKYVFDCLGRNSRIDELQAAVLSEKLRHLDSANARRRAIAQYYIENIHNAAVTIPGVNPTSHLSPLTSHHSPLTSHLNTSVWHIFPVLSPHRDTLKQFMSDRGVQTDIHYPIPPHRQACYPEWHSLCLPITERIHAQELSLPCHQAMTDAEVETVVDIINSFKS